MMLSQEFVVEFGFMPNAAELRIANGRDPHDEAVAFDEMKWQCSLHKYRNTWKRRGDALRHQGGDAHLTQPDILPKPMETAAESLPCCHRGTEPRASVCDLCGTKGQPLQVFSCALHGECSLNKKRRDTRACVSCDDRNAIAPLLSVCLPHYRDWPGVWATVAGILRDAKAAGILDQIEIVVGDQSPDSGDGRKVKDYLQYVPNGRYVALEPHGSARAKDDTIRAARGRWFCLLDCHAMFDAGSFVAMFGFIKANQDSPDLFGGVIVTQTLGKNEYSSHLDRTWQGNTLGVWQRDPRAANPHAEPFEVENLAGWFLVGRRDGWLDVSPYHQDFRGFGGEEGVMSLAYRSRGRRVMVLPCARAEHRFGYADGPTFSIDLADRVRNYFIAFHQFDQSGLSVDAMRTYFTQDRANDPTLKDARNWTDAEFDAACRNMPPPSATCRDLPPTAADVFTDIHARKLWGDGESVSGPGSGLDATATIRQEIPKLIATLDIGTLLDLPCGDFHWQSEVADSAGSYIGADIVPALIDGNRQKFRRGTFEVLDIISDPLPRADLVLVRDCFVHLPYADIRRALANLIASGSRWLLATTFPGRINHDIPMGHWRPLDLTAEPFSLPPPERIINEGCREGGGAFADKSLGLWDLSKLVLPPEPTPSDSLTPILKALANAEASDGYSIVVASTRGKTLTTFQSTTTNFPRATMADVVCEYLTATRGKA